MTAMRLIFMGTPKISVPALSMLLNEGYEIACVYSQPPRPSGRGHRMSLSPLHKFAKENGIDVQTPGNFKSVETIKTFAEYNADIAVVMAYGLILPKVILETPRLGCVNIHVSLLPRWRGAAPIQRAILAGDTETGVTIMQMEEGLDTGPILRQDISAIKPHTTAEGLNDELAILSAKSIHEALVGLQDGQIDPIPQQDEGSTYAKKIKREEGLINWHHSAIDIERRIRALNPWPGTWFERGGECIRILSAEVSSEKGVAGTVLDKNALIACNGGSIRPLVMQRPGKVAMDVDSFLRGYDLPVGSVLGTPTTEKK
ncbi:MAG: methionyl-tRNA formyltransferase [Rhodospirillaceae bacterium]|nr:methionyl-tRNA formyltransferase [Rhodospirillaceae bacterium]